MAEQFVKLPDDSANTGKKMRVVENTVNAVVVEQEVVGLADLAGADLSANVKNLDVLLSTRTKPADQQHTIIDSGSIGNTAFGVTGDVAVVNSATGGKTKIATTPDNPSNLDVALSTRLKPGDTLTGVTTVTNLSQLGGAAVAMGTGARSAGTQRVTVATDDVVPVSAAGLTNLDIALSTRTKPADQQHVIVDTMSPALALDATVNALLKPASTLAGVTTVAAVTAITNALPAGTNRIGSVRPVDSADVDLTTVKGTQTARALGTQDLIDSGRVIIKWTAEFSPAAVAETLLTITESRDGAATTTFSSKVVTSGKRLRITSIGFAVENTLGTALQRAYLRMRFNTAGAVTTASPQQTVTALQAIGTVKSITSIERSYPDGIEYLGDGTKQIGFTLAAPDWVTATSTLKVYVSIFGFEY